ncbi:MAG: sigma-54 dependent transcriptional regulator [Acidobacteriota bacterium]|jgi:two-component system NtrC family response regulator
MKNKGRIVVVDDDESLRRVVQFQLQQAGYDVIAEPGGAQALQALQQSPRDLVITDLRMPGLSGLELLRKIRTDFPEVSVIIVTAFGTVETAVDAMKAGAYDYITKPVNPEELKLIIERALNHQHLLEEVRTLRSNLDQKYGFENIIGRSGALLYVLDLAARAAQTSTTVLIHGETGTGKELVAKAIHFNSPRKDRPFVTINCSAIPQDLLESELFGHLRGAFTGAAAHRKGKVEMADGGTLFLDEIGDLPPSLQVKLLRLIQQGEIEKIGASVTLQVDVRIVAATHRNLERMVEDSSFREDLYYRLAVIPLEVPPLRERPEDIPELTQHFFLQSCRKHGRTGLLLPQALIPYFCHYRWPGNIRELENVVERLVVLEQGNEITLEDLPAQLRRERSPVEMDQIELSPHGVSLEAIEKELILWALRKSNWNQTRAAALLDLSRKTFIYRMEKHSIPKENPVASS